jgi:hypothetical protein
MQKIVKKSRFIGVLSWFVERFPKGTLFSSVGEFIVVYHPTDTEVIPNLLFEIDMIFNEGKGATNSLLNDMISSLRLMESGEERKGGFDCLW